MDLWTLSLYYEYRIIAEFSAKRQTQRVVLYIIMTIIVINADIILSRKLTKTSVPTYRNIL